MVPSPTREECARRSVVVVYLGGVEFAVMQLQDAQSRLQVGLRLRQLHLDGPQAVDVRRRQVHPQQGQVHLRGRNAAVRTSIFFTSLDQSARHQDTDEGHAHTPFTEYTTNVHAKLSFRYVQIRERLPSSHQALCEKVKNQLLP